MRLSLSIVFLFVPAVLIAMPEILPATPVSELMFTETTNGLESSLEYNFVSTGKSNDAQMTSVEYIKCPIIMCAPRHDAFVALRTLTSSEWNMANITNGYELMFGRKIGSFSSARVTFFNPPNSQLYHCFKGYDQIESIMATAIVQCASFESGVVELERVKLAFENVIDNCRLFERRSIQDGIVFATPAPTSSGWYIELSAMRRLGHDVLYSMVLFRKRSKVKHSDADTDMQIDVDM